MPEHIRNSETPIMAVFRLGMIATVATELPAKADCVGHVDDANGNWASCPSIPPVPLFALPKNTSQSQLSLRLQRNEGG